MSKGHVNLYKYNEITGLWNYQRSCEPETAEAWLRIFQQGDNRGHFRLAKTSPKGKPKGP